MTDDDILNFEIQAELGKALRSGQTLTIKNLLKNPKLQKNDYYYAILDHSLETSCTYGYFDVVQYVLTSKELSKHANIFYDDNSPLIQACAGGHLDIVKYLLTSLDLIEHSNLHAKGDQAFKFAAKYKQYDIVKYLIVELNIPKSKEIKDYLISRPDTKIEELFKLRELNKDLEKDLPMNDSKNRKNKI